MIWLKGILLGLLVAASALLAGIALTLLIAIVHVKTSKADELDYGRTCLALAAFGEQNEQQPEGMLLVQLTIINRLLDDENRYGMSICDVVQQNGQFIGYEKLPLPRRPWISNPGRWAMAMETADRVIDRRYEIPGPCVGDSPILYFHSGDRAYWEPRLQLECYVDGHYFYSERK